MPGAPTPASVSAMRSNAQTGVANTSKVYQWTGDHTGPSASNEFPIVTVPKDAYDDIANIKSQYADGAQVGTNWVVPFDQADAQFLMRKRDAEEKAEFDAWVTQRYNLSDPSQNLMLQRIAPELFTRREEVINSLQDLVSRYAKLRLRGAQSIDDLRLEWLIETGRLDLPKGPIWNPLQWRAEQANYVDKTRPNKDAGGNDARDIEFNSARYRRGLFNPLTWLTRDNAGWAPNARNRADIYGDPRTPYHSPNVPYPGRGWANIWSSPAPYPYAGANTVDMAAGGPGPIGAPDTRANRVTAVNSTYPGA